MLSKFNVDKKNPIPIYFQMAEQIREDILKNNYQPGTRLCSERLLMKKNNLSLTTVRQAYQLLIDEGLVVKHQGKGAFVADSHSGKEVTIKIYADVNIISKNIWLNLIDKFNNKYPYITIECLFGRNYVDDGVQIESFKPDVFCVDDSIWHKFEAGKLLLNLKDYLKDSKTLVKEVAPELLAYFTKSDNLYAVPYRFSTQALFCCKEIFNRKGINLPERSITWKQFLELAKGLTQKKGNGYVKHYGFGEPMSLSNLMCYIHQNGGVIFDGQQSLFDSSLVIEAIQFWFEEMLFKHHASPLPNTEIIKQLFANNKLAMTVQKYDYTQMHGANFHKNWGVYPLFYGKKRASSLSIQGLAISSKTKLLDSSWKFLDFFITQQQSLDTKGIWGLPVNISRAESMPFGKVFTDSLSYATPPWPYPFRTPRKIINEELKLLAANMQSSETTCKRIARRWNRLPSTAN